MFEKLFAESGLSLDRLRALLEVNAAGSIVKAAIGDPVKQSQYSRQIKELEDFFRIKLVERHGKGIRLTSNGKELARISRFFLLGLSNFQRGCLAEEQTFRVGASRTFIDHFLLPVLSDNARLKAGPRYAVEIASDDEIERRLHDLTLDFGIVTTATLSRPLQLKDLGGWKLNLWLPCEICRNEPHVSRALKERRLPMILPVRELPPLDLLDGYEPCLTCDSFVEALIALRSRNMATFLPDFLKPETGDAFRRVRVSGISNRTFHHRLAWNPRLLRLNPHMIRRRDFLLESLTMRLRS